MQDMINALEEKIEEKFQSLKEYIEATMQKLYSTFHASSLSVQVSQPAHAQTKPTFVGSAPHAKRV